jgi:transcriptional regulator with XRE-family HTH domain
LVQSQRLARKGPFRSPSLDGERNGPLTGLETAGHVGTKAGPWVFAGRVKPSLDYLDQIDINYRDHSQTQDNPALSPEQRAAVKAIRDRSRQEHPGPDELIDSGEIDDLVLQTQYIELRALMVRLRELRERMGLSLTEASERTGLTRAAISRLENGWNVNLTLETLYRYTEALGVGLKFAVDESAEPGTADDGKGLGPESIASSEKTLRRKTSTPPAQGQPATSNDSDLAAVVKAWDRLPAAIRAGVVAMVKAAAKA